MRLIAKRKMFEWIFDRGKAQKARYIELLTELEGLKTLYKALSVRLDNLEIDLTAAKKKKRLKDDEEQEIKEDKYKGVLAYE